MYDELYHHCSHYCTKSGKGMATFQKRGKTWRAIIRKKGYKPISKTFLKKTVAKDWANKIESQMAEHSFDEMAGNKGLTVADAIQKYIDTIAPLKPMGRSKQYTLNRLLKSPIGARPTIDLSPDDFVAHFKSRMAKNTLPQTITIDAIHLLEVLKIARLMWKFPIREKLAEDVRETLKFHNLIKKSRKRVRRPSTEEITKLKTYYDNNKRLQLPMSDIVDFAVATAMRLGEICRISWDDMDSDKRTVVIRDRKSPDEKQGNDQTVPLLPEAMVVIERQPKLDHRIFPFNARSVSAAFTRACQKPVVNIKDLRFHDLRHEGTARLFERGYQIHEVSLFTGHKDWGSLKRYTQLKPEDLHRD